MLAQTRRSFLRLKRQTKAVLKYQIVESINDKSVPSFYLFSFFLFPLFYKQVVFVGPFEHHSNILPWKETGAKVTFFSPNTVILLAKLNFAHQGEPGPSSRPLPEKM